MSSDLILTDKSPSGEYKHRRDSPATDTTVKAHSGEYKHRRDSPATDTTVKAQSDEYKHRRDSLATDTTVKAQSGKYKHRRDSPATDTTVKAPAAGTKIGETFLLQALHQSSKKVSRNKHADLKRGLHDHPHLNVS